MGQRTDDGDNNKKKNDMKITDPRLDKLEGMLSHKPRVKRKEQSDTRQNLPPILMIAPNLESKKIVIKRSNVDDEEFGMVVKKEQNMSGKEKSALYDHLKSYIPPKKIKTSFLPSTVEELYDKICLLIGELKAGNHCHS